MDRAQSPSQIPASSSKYHRPYFTQKDIDYLSDKRQIRGPQEEKIRQKACSFLEALGGRIGFPRRAIATAQSLYHRFHLFFPRKDFNYHDVALAAAYVSTKMHDTLKKPRELLAVSYALRYPELVAKSKNPAGEVDLDTVDPSTVEHDRQRLLAVERLILETICFNFTSRLPFPYVIKIGRALGADKKLVKLAWRLVVDSHRTYVPIQYPPATVALSSLYVAACLLSLDVVSPLHQESQIRSAQEIRTLLSQNGDWETRFQAHVEDLHDVAQTVLDLLIHATQLPSTNTSPSTPSSPHASHASPRNHHLYGPNDTIPYNVDQLTQLKIALRELEHRPRPRRDHYDTIEDPSSVIGKNEGSVRFLFAPPEFVKAV